MGTALATGLLAPLLGFMAVAPALAADAPTPQAPSTTERGDKARQDSPRNPYDMKALRQFDAGSHRAEEKG